MQARIIRTLTSISLLRNSARNISNSPVRLSSRNKQSSAPNNGLFKRSYGHNMPKTPELIYIPDIYRWLKTKIQFKHLQKTWDPHFTEGAFIYGTSKAVCRITEIIHENSPEQLDGLMTDEAKKKLVDVMKLKLTKAQKTIIKIAPEDIKILVPMNVVKKKEGLEKNCKVGMRVLALKWFRQNKKTDLKLVLVAIQAEFLKNYRDGPESDWWISSFEIMDCAILSAVNP